MGERDSDGLDSGDPTSIEPSPVGFDIGRLSLPTRQRVVQSRFVRDVGSLWTGQAGVLVISAIQGLIVARLLGPRSYGIAGLIASFPALVYVFVDARSADAGVRYLGEFAAKGDVVRARAFCKLGFLLEFGISLCALGLVALFAPWAQTHIVHSAGASALLIAYAAGMVLRSPAVTSGAALITLGRFRLMGGLQVATTLVRAALVIALVVAGAGVAGVIWGSVIGLALEGLVSMLVAGHFIRTGWGGGWVSARLGELRGRGREIAHFVIWSDIGSLLGLAAKQTDVLVVGSVLGPAAAGYYRLAISIGSVGAVAVAPLQSVVYQRFARLRGKGDAQGFWHVVRRTALHVALPLGALGLVAIPFVPLAVRILVGPAYAAAVPAAQVLVLSSALWMMLCWVRPLALTLGEVRFWALVGGVAAVLSFVGYLVVTPAFGFVGTAWTRLVFMLVPQLVAAWYLRHRYVHGGKGRLDEAALAGS